MRSDPARDGDRLSIELDDRGRLILERLDPTPLVDPVEHQRQLRDDWSA